MPPTKKSSSATKTAAAAAKRPSPTHPTWHDMIKECIAAHHDDARSGVSRPQIKKFVEENYRIEIGAAQNTQLSKAIAKGEEKGEFVLPKGPSGRVKLATKTRTVKGETSASKENKPAVAKKPATKAQPKIAMARKATMYAAPSRKPVVVKKSRATRDTSTATKKPVVKPTTARSKAAAEKKAAQVADKEKADRKVKKAKAVEGTEKVKKAVPKKVVPGKSTAKATEKKAGAASKRGTAKKAATGATATSKAKTAATKASSKTKAAPAKKGQSTAPRKAIASRRKAAAK